jgi:hypothetical protein
MSVSGQRNLPIMSVSGPNNIVPKEFWEIEKGKIV